MHFRLLVLLVATGVFLPDAIAKSSHHRKIRCFVGEKEDNHLSPRVYDYCSGYYSFSGETVSLMGHTGEHPNRKFFEDNEWEKKTHGCELEINENDEMGVRCYCFKSQCNAPHSGRDLMKTALNFVKLSDDFLHADDADEK